MSFKTTIEEDANGHVVQESVKRKAIKKSATVSIAASGADATATISVPEGELWYIKAITVTKGTNVTVDSITIDGEVFPETATVSDVEASYGALVSAEKFIAIQGDNANTTVAEDLTIEVTGYSIV
ncbi:hypothetical protein [Paludifilum halophilum]|uniref:Uncharacterized protein n=1 Tax=Paludifilum halophilum TaxID=1642702 RepID=A0A235B897_9BACL|nr:hypothetical protein [Paludifilum halophilum]OYD08538.1 hypothetical protein CHM34_06845 [Paludifilum halophilum]